MVEKTGQKGVEEERKKMKQPMPMLYTGMIYSTREYSYKHTHTHLYIEY